MFKKPFEKNILLQVIEEKFKVVLEKEKFKFRKNKLDFIKKFKDFTYKISFNPDTIFLSYDEENRLANTQFVISYTILTSKYNDWISEKLNKKIEYSHLMSTSFVSMSFELINIFNLTKGGSLFKDYTNDLDPFKEEYENLVIDHLSKYKQEKSVSADKYISNFLPSLLNELIIQSDYYQLFLNRKYPLKFESINLLVFIGENEKAKEMYDQSYLFKIEKIKNGNDEYKEFLKEFIKDAEILIGIKYKE